MARKRKIRSYGAGRVFPRKGSSFLWIGYCVDGKERRESAESSDPVVAQELLAKRLAERNRGELVSIHSGVYTVRELLATYLDSRAKLAPGTRATYESQAHLHLNPFFGDIPVNRIATDLLSDYRDKRRKEEIQQGNNAKTEGGTEKKRRVGSTSINRELAFLRAAMRDLWKRRPKMLSSVPYFPMESERDNVRQGFLREDKLAEKLLPELPRHLVAIAACAFYGSGRKGEWLKLDWDMVDFDKLEINMPGRITKNRKSRTVPIVDGIMLLSLLEAKRLRDAAWPEEAAVFCYQGKRLTTFKTSWEKACKRAGMEGLLFHDLRRSANKHQRDKGISQRTRMQISGHLTPSMDNRYGIVDLQDVDDAREKLNTEAPVKLRRVK